MRAKGGTSSAATELLARPPFTFSEIRSRRAAGSVADTKLLAKLLWGIAKFEREVWVKLAVFQARGQIWLSTSVLWMKLAVTWPMEHIWLSTSVLWEKLAMPLMSGHISELRNKLAVFLARRHIWLSTSFPWMTLAVFLSREHIWMSFHMLWKKLAVYLARAHIWLSTSSIRGELAVFLPRKHLWLSDVGLSLQVAAVAVTGASTVIAGILFTGLRRILCVEDPHDSYCRTD